MAKTAQTATRQPEKNQHEQPCGIDGKARQKSHWAAKQGM
nr:MAG TPA: hypothetical protein [Caudoviricetes sp.]